MGKKMIKNDGNSEVIALTQDTRQQILTPIEEYKKAMRKRRGRKALFVLLIVVEIFIGLYILGCFEIYDLHYRVTKQVENTITGKNKFPTGTYTGETDFGYFIGDGTFDFKSGVVYSGQWNDNHMQGLGTLMIPSEGTYKGEFIDSQKSGKGVFTWENGTTYDGEWKYDMMNGQGVYISADDVNYKGTFLDNQFWEGTCNFDNDTGTYIAEYKDGHIDNLNVLFKDGTSYNGATDGVTLTGTGTMQFANGDKYTGVFENGFRNIEGVYTWSNGDVYDGAWDSDSMSGSGSYTYADGSCAQGTFVQNQFVEGSYKVVNSFGEYTFTIEDRETVAVKMVLTDGTTYSGDMEDGKLTGSAQITYSNGDKYSGRVNDGYKSGQGTYTWSSGASYEGDWENDKMHGSGTYFYPEKENGYKLSGNFEKGVPNGQCQYYESATESYKTDWSKGKCVKIYE